MSERNEEEENQDEPLIKEVSTHPPRDDKGRPTLPASLYERPPVPEINPMLREALAQPLTLADCQYAVNTLKNRIIERFQKLQKEKPAQVIPASQQVREMQAAIDVMSEYLTKGYTVDYQPPTANQKGGKEEGFLGNLDDLLGLFDQINPEVKDKMGKTLGKLFDMLNQKLGVT